MFNLNVNMFDPAAMIQGMRDEMVQAGFRELRTPEEVDQAFREAKGSALVFVNSVCGCAGGIARPAARYVVSQGAIRPDHLFTVFAGQDKEATARAREYFEGYPPSSPSMALMKDGKIVAMVQRHEIEGRDAAAVAAHLTQLWSSHFGTPATGESR